MPINRQDIDHIAELARLDLSIEEKDVFGQQFESILAYIGQLQELDTQHVDITAQVSGLLDVWRSDEVRPWDKDEVAAALAQGEGRDGYIKVKKVLADNTGL